VRDSVSWLWGQISPIFDHVWGTVSAWVGWSVDTILPAIAGGVSDIVGGFGQFGREVVNGFQGLFEFLLEGLRGLISFFVGDLFRPAVDTMSRKFNLPIRYARGDFLSVDSFTQELLDPPILDNFLTAVGWAVAAIFSLIYSFFPALQPINQRIIQDANVQWRPARLTVQELLDAELRGISVPDGVDLQLARWGFSDDNIAALRALRQLLPTPTDLVRFGVREVFTPEVAARFGQFDDFPEQFANEMALVGFNRERALQYWAAHWDLPSATQGFEMLHRGIISFEELQLLLRSLDVMPFWRDKLIQISYNPLTRVDVRRMYQAGVLDEDQVFRAYLDLGYTPDNARHLTDWTKIAYPRGSDGPGGDLRNLTVATIRNAYVRRLIDRDEALDRLVQLDYSVDDAELQVSIWDFDLTVNPFERSVLDLKDLSRSVIERAYERRVFDFNRALVELVELGYTQEDAEIMLALVDQRLQEQLTDLQIDVVLNDLEAGFIDESTAVARLGAFGLHPERIDFLVQREVLRRQASTRRLTVTQLYRARAAGIIPTDQELLDRFVRLGYNQADAAILVAIR